MALGEKLTLQGKGPYLKLDVYKGHYATSHGHMNYFIDIAANKASLKEAKAIANTLAEHFRFTTPVDTILCLDGSEVIGAFFAEALAKNDRFSVNADRNIYALTPEHISGSQLFFRDNTSPMIRDKNVLILAASVVTGFTVKTALETVQYYGGRTVGIASIFSSKKECAGLPIISVFDTRDIDGYMTAPAIECPLCKQGVAITALVNPFGASAL